jgi:hypothetical protein
MAPGNLLPLLFAGLLSTTGAYQDLGVLPETYCITHTSTYLVPVSAAASASRGIQQSFSSEDGLVATSSEPKVQTTTSEPEFQTTISEPTAQPAEPGDSLLNIILRIVPNSQDVKRDQRLQARALGGLVGAQSGICEDADRFSLLGGSLLDGDLPIYYNGEDFKELSGQPGPVPAGAISTTFSVDSNGFVQFSNSLLPSGEAGFCQVSDSGQVYLTFTSSPPNCKTVRLAIIGCK